MVKIQKRSHTPSTIHRPLSVVHSCSTTIQLCQFLSQKALCYRSPFMVRWSPKRPAFIMEVVLAQPPNLLQSLNQTQLLFIWIFNRCYTGKAQEPAFENGSYYHKNDLSTHKAMVLVCCSSSGGWLAHAVYCNSTFKMSMGLSVFISTGTGLSIGLSIFEYANIYSQQNP